MGTTIEATSPTLRAALDTLAAERTPAAYLGVASAYQALGIADTAFDYLLEGVSHHPRESDLHGTIARQWRDWGLPARGLRHAHLAVRYRPASAAAQTTLATILWSLGHRAEAVDAFATASALAPDAAYARFNLCAAVTALGRVAPGGCGTDRPPAVTLPKP